MKTGLSSKRQSARVLSAENRSSQDIDQSLESNRLIQLAEENASLRATILMRGHMLAHVAHEIRTPLSTIRGYARMVAEGRAGEVTEKQKEYLETIAENTGRLVEMVAWMTKIGDPDNQRMNLTELDGRVLWQQCIEARREQFSAKRIAIEESFAEESYPLIGDLQRLTGLFQQILTLGLRYTSEGGRLSMAMSRPREGGLGVKFSGMGGGMADAAESVGNAATSDRAGLEEMNDAAGLHGGRLFIRRTAEEGSVILFTLPDVREAIAGEDSGKKSA